MRVIESFPSDALILPFIPEYSRQPWRSVTQPIGPKPFSIDTGTQWDDDPGYTPELGRIWRQKKGDRVMKLVVIGLFLVAGALAGCSTTPISTATAAYVPSSRIYHPSYIGAAKSSRDGTVIFLRDAGLFGSGCSHDMYIDNVKVFAIRHAEQITIHLPAGRHFFRLETGGGLCPNIAESQETTLEAGQREVWRILIPSTGSLHLTRLQ